MAGTRTNPSDVGKLTEYAGNVAPKRADASTVAPGGNVVNRDTINKTYDTVSSKGTQAKPGGEHSSSGR